MRWLGNILSNYLRFGTSIVVMIVMTPYIITEIGPEQYALWVILLSATAIVNLTDLGFATAAIKFLAEPEGRGDIQRRNELAGLLQRIYTVIAALCFGFTMTIVHGTEIVPAGDGLEFLFMSLGVTTSIVLLLTVHRAALIAAGRQTIVNILTIIGTLAQAGITIWLLETGHGLDGIVFANIAGTLLPAIVCVPMAKFRLDGFEARFSHASLQELHRILPFTAHAFVANLAFLLVFRIDPLLIEAWIGLEAVAIFAVAIKIAEQALLLNKQFSNALMPLVSQIYGRDTSSDNVRLFTAATRYLAIVAFPLLAVVAIFAESILVIWVGPDFAMAAPVLQLLSLAVLCSSLQLNAANYLGMTGHSGFVARTVMAAALVKLIISVALLPSLGIKACAVGFVFSALFVEFIPMTLRACRHAAMPFRKFAAESIVPAAAATLPAVFIGITMSSPENLYELFTAASLSGLASLLIFIAVCMRQQEWREVTKLFQHPPSEMREAI